MLQCRPFRNETRHSHGPLNLLKYQQKIAGMKIARCRWHGDFGLKEVPPHHFSQLRCAGSFEKTRGPMLQASGRLLFLARGPWALLHSVFTQRPQTPTFALKGHADTSDHRQRSSQNA